MSVIDYVQVGKRLRQVRGSQSQSIFAKKYNKRQAQISKIENGKEITLDWLYEISENEGVSLDFLVKGRTEETTIQTNTKKDIPLKMSDSQVDYLRLYQSDTLPNIVLDALFSEEGSNVIGTLAYILNEWIDLFHKDASIDLKMWRDGSFVNYLDTTNPVKDSYENNKTRLLFTYAESNILDVIKSFLSDLYDKYKHQNYKTSSVYVFNGCLELIHKTDIGISDICNNYSLIYLLFKGFKDQFEVVINRAISNDEGALSSFLINEDNATPLSYVEDGAEIFDFDIPEKDFASWGIYFKKPTQNLISFLNKWDTKSEYSGLIHTQISKLENHISWIEREVKKYE